MPVLIGFCGAGKSTAARHPVEHHGFVRLPTAGPLKGMLWTLLLGQGMADEDVERMVDSDLKEVPARALDGRNLPPLHADARHGTGQGALFVVLRVNAWKRSLAGLERVVADDVRFNNEAEAIHDIGGSVTEVRRARLVPLASSHPSEAVVSQAAIDIVLPNHSTCAALAILLGAYFGR